nr:hypothetical protein [Ningiella sp. W23]
MHTYVDNFIEDEDFSFSVPPRNRDYQAKLIWDIDNNNVLRATASGAKITLKLNLMQTAATLVKTLI